MKAIGRQKEKAHTIQKRTSANLSFYAYLSPLKDTVLEFKLQTEYTCSLSSWYHLQSCMGYYISYFLSSDWLNISRVCEQGGSGVRHHIIISVLPYYKNDCYNKDYWSMFYKKIPFQSFYLKKVTFKSMCYFLCVPFICNN